MLGGGSGFEVRNGEGCRRNLRGGFSEDLEGGKGKSYALRDRGNRRQHHDELTMLRINLQNDRAITDSLLFKMQPFTCSLQRLGSLVTRALTLTQLPLGPSTLS